MGAYIWTAERRAAQAQRARTKMPWRHSTGPRTAAGKKIVSMNSYRHGMRSAALKNLRSYMKAQQKFLQAVRYFHALRLKICRTRLRSLNRLLRVADLNHGIHGKHRIFREFCGFRGSNTDAGICFAKPANDVIFQLKEE